MMLGFPMVYVDFQQLEVIADTSRGEYYVKILEWWSISYGQENWVQIWFSLRIINCRNVVEQ